MRRVIGLALVGLCAMAIHAYAAGQDEKIYEDLVLRAKAGDLTIDWRVLRLTCMRVQACQPRGSKADLALLGKKTPLEDNLRVALKLIDEGFPNIEAHASASGIYRALGNMEKAQAEYAITLSLMRSIVDGHDGKTKETAYEVITGREEYFVLTALKLPYYGPGVTSSLVLDGAHKFSR